MSLARLFLISGALAAIVLGLSGIGLYGVAAWHAGVEGMAAVRLVAETTAKNLEHTLALAGGTLEQLAQEPEFPAALESGDPARRLAAEERLTRLVPGALLVRLVPDTIEAPDEDRVPRMGFADLDMARRTQTGQPPPAVHAANSPDAHLALARRLGQGKGVILASLTPKLILSALPAGLDRGALELRQQSLSLGFTGDSALKQAPPDGGIPVSGAPWTLAYWGPPSAEVGGLWFLAFPVLAALLLGGTGYFAYRWSARALAGDQANIVQLVRDLLSDKRTRRYPLRFKEMSRLMAELESLRHLVVVERPPRPTLLEPMMPAPHGDSDGLPEEVPEEFLAFLGNPPPAAPSVPEAPPVIVSPTIFRAYDIRGVVGETLTPEIIQLIGRAIGSEARERGEYTVALARDGRSSSLELSQALGQGLVASGCSVVDLGMVPTPVLYFATHVLNTESGVMITGSHNPPEYNGLKIVIAGETLAEKEIQKLHARIERKDFLAGQGQMAFRNLVADYRERIVHDAQLGRPLKIVVDCGNGAASHVAPALLEELGCGVTPLFCEVDGNFPNHHPDPGDPKNLEALIRKVREQEADLGVAFDGDGDRLGVVDSSGKIIWPDRQLMLFAADVLSREPGADIIFDVKCTRHLPGFIVRHGGRPMMWKSGHSLMKAKLRETGALLAGEMSGHIFFKERWYGFDDGLYACVRLAEILSHDPRSSAEVFAELPDSVNTPELKIALAEGESERIMRKLKEIADFPEARITDIDGLRADFADGWGLMRASNTLPSLVLRFEGDTPEALRRIVNEFKALLLKVKPDISFPPTLNSI